MKHQERHHVTVVIRISFADFDHFLLVNEMVCLCGVFLFTLLSVVKENEMMGEDQPLVQTMEGAAELCSRLCVTDEC